MKFDSLYQELQHSTEMIRALLSGVSQEEAQVKPNAESWSTLEVVCHLYDIEREDFREHPDFIVSTSLNASLHRQDEEYHAIDPQGWVKARKYNEQSFLQLQEKLFAERRQSLEWLRGLPNPNWETTYASQYGTTSAGEMFACWVAHDNLHIRQLVELRRMKIENMTKPYNLEYAGEW